MKVVTRKIWGNILDIRIRPISRGVRRPSLWLSEKSPETTHSLVEPQSSKSLKNQTTGNDNAAIRPPLWMNFKSTSTPRQARESRQHCLVPFSYHYITPTLLANSCVGKANSSRWWDVSMHSGSRQEPVYHRRRRAAFPSSCAEIDQT